MPTDLTKYVNEMQDHLVTEQAELDTRLEAVAEQRDVVKRLNGAIKALAPGTTKTKTKQTDAYEWTPSEKVIAPILEVFQEAEEPLTLTEIRERSGANKAATEKVVRVLRKREQVRLAGKRGMAQVYELMRVPAGMTPGEDTEGNHGS